MSLTDSRKFYVLLRDAGSEGVHSWDAAKLIPSRNVSQRSKDIASKGVGLCVAVERRNGRPGSRFWLAEHAPDFAVAVRPNNDVEVGSESPPIAADPGAESESNPGAMSGAGRAGTTNDSIVDSHPGPPVALHVDALDPTDIRFYEVELGDAA